MDNKEIVQRLIDRDESGLSYLYQYYAASLNGLILNIVGSEPLAEEVLQHTFLKIWDNISSYNSTKATLFTWMARIARNNAIDKIRLKRHQHNQLTDSLSPDHHQAKVMQLSNANIDTENLLNKIDIKYRSVLDCIYLQGYSQSEAAKKLNLPLGTVKTRVRKAVSMLRRELSSEKALFTASIVIIIYLLQLLCL